MSEPKMTVTPRPADHTSMVPAADRDYWKQRAGEAEAERDAVYRERAHLVAALAAHYPSEFRENPDPDYEDWPIVYVALPTGQASWHISPKDTDLFSHVRFGTSAEWDGHTTEEKYRRIRANTAQLAGGWDVYGDGKPF